MGTSQTIHLIMNTLKILTIIIAILFVIGCEPENKQQILQDIKDKDFLQESFKVTYYYSDSAIMKAKITTPHLVEKKVGQDIQTEANRGIKIEFYTPSGAIESYLVADKARLYNEKSIGEASGNVIVYNDKQEKLETEKLIWEQHKNILHTNSFVKITTPKEVIFGEGLESNTTFTKYKIFKIKGTLTIQE